MNLIILALSGGMDSTALLHFYRSRGHKVIPVWFHYGSKHNAYEQKAVEAIAAAAELQLHKIDLTKAFEYTSSDLLLTGGDIPEGHYNDATMSKTVVPGRNLVFASILASIAESHVNSGKCVGATVALGVHAGDHYIYPDCRPDFIKSLRETIEASTESKVTVDAPFLYMTKADVLSVALSCGAPLELTRTCYKAQELSCGKCGSCRERLEAFELNNTKDVIAYE